MPSASFDETEWFLELNFRHKRIDSLVLMFDNLEKRVDDKPNEGKRAASMPAICVEKFACPR